jgi:hypothetical protein
MSERAKRLAAVVALALLAVGLFWYVTLQRAKAASTLTITDTTTINGGLSVVGALSKGSGTFLIDHPLDPINKLLYHSFVESPDTMNIYDGIAVLDRNGSATVVLPSYFLALNRDFRYLLTPVGQPMPGLYIKSEVRRSFFGLLGSPQFAIAGGVAGGKVSWQVTGIRHDIYIEENPIIPEVEKGPGKLVGKGEFILEDVYNANGTVK